MFNQRVALKARAHGQTPVHGGRLAGQDRVLRVAATFFLTALLVFWATVEGWSQDQTISDSTWHWHVERVSGRVRAETKSGETFLVKRGMIVRSGWKIRTGNGRVAIERDGEKFVVSRGSVVTLEPKGFLVKQMVVYQDRGQIDVDVKRRWYRHFKVETPFLAAVVKGTKFRVRVTQGTASVNVGRGVVGVHDFASGNLANVGAGQSASTSPGRRVGLTVRGKTRPDITQGPKRAPAFKTRIARNVPATAAEARAENASSNANSNSASTGNSNGTGNGNGNSGGNSNGNSGGNSNGNSGGNGNGNSGGNGNGNSGGNGNGNSGGNGNGNSGGNGNGNSGGNGNGNSGGNGNGNSGGNGNGNSGGNGNGNSGGNGNGNSGGNGKGKNR